MEMESRRRELERKRRRRKRQLRRRILAGGLVCGALSLGVGAWGGARWLGLVTGDGSDVSSGPGEGVADGMTEAESGGGGVNAGAVEAEMNDVVVETRASEIAADAEGTDLNLALDEAGIVSGETTVEMASGRDLEMELPERFDLREQGSAPTVPDQGAFGTCWAFASLGALESSMSEKLRMSLSADHMSIRNSFGLGQDAGGDHSISSAYLLGWQGPVAEAADPYGDAYSPENLDLVCHVQEIRILKEKDYEAIKRAVYETGGVQSSFYMPQTEGAERDRYYNEETYAFYYDGSLEANHDVVIVGWEDSYPKENFVEEPEEDGAFLCMNTWGESFGDRGCFYISYEDSRIGTINISYTGIEDTDNYDAICQTDLCGWTGQLGYGSPKAWFANVYEAPGDSFLAAVGFYATVPETGYKVYVEVCGESERDGSDGVRKEAGRFSERVLAAEGYAEDAGYYTVVLNDRSCTKVGAGKVIAPGAVSAPEWPEEAGRDALLEQAQSAGRSEAGKAGEAAGALQLAVGQRFAVIVEMDSPGTTEPVAVEYAAGERTAQVDISDGEGYVSPDGEHWQRAETELQCNVCLKAYLRDAETP